VRGSPGATHKVQPSKPIGSLHAVSRIQTNAPEGGGTTQRGDPAPGPM
jgi:hypothetical protein